MTKYLKYLLKYPTHFYSGRTDFTNFDCKPNSIFEYKSIVDGNKNSDNHNKLLIDYYIKKDYFSVIEFPDVYVEPVFPSTPPSDPPTSSDIMFSTLCPTDVFGGIVSRSNDKIYGQAQFSGSHNTIMDTGIITEIDPGTLGSVVYKSEYGEAYANGPIAKAADNTLYFVCNANFSSTYPEKIKKLDSTDTITTFKTLGSGVLVRGMSVDQTTGNLYVATSYDSFAGGGEADPNIRILKFLPDGTQSSFAVIPYTQSMTLADLNGLSIGGSSNHLFVSIDGNVEEYALDGTHIGNYLTLASPRVASGILVDSLDGIWIIDDCNQVGLYYYDSTKTLKVDLVGSSPYAEFKNGTPAEASINFAKGICLGTDKKTLFFIDISSDQGNATYLRKAVQP